MPNNSLHPHLSSNGAHYMPKHISRFTVQPPRTLHEFTRPQEVLRAVRDAIAAHKHHYMATGTIHGGVNVDTILIGAPPAVPHAQGFLIQPSPRTDDATFKSVRALSGLLYRKLTFPLDYLDDLESFYYVLLWMCYSYDGVVGGRPYYIPLHQRAPVLTCLATNPTSRESILEKEAMLFGTGIVFDLQPISEFWGGEKLEELLDHLHFIIASRYKEKTELGRPRATEELRSDSIKDYGTFMKAIDDALFMWERQG